MKHPNDEREPDAPRWMELAATLRAEPAPDTLARVRRRLTAARAEPAWLRLLSRPVAVAASAALLVASAIAGEMLLAGASAEASDESLTSALLGDDGSFGLGLEQAAAGTVNADSEAVAP
jgi:anti-sigma factor RsiW